MAKVQFGRNQIYNETPKGAKVVFIIVIVLTSFIAIWVAATSTLMAAQKTEWMLILKCIDGATFALSRMFGIKPEDYKPRAKY